MPLDDASCEIYAIFEINQNETSNLMKFQIR